MARPTNHAQVDHHPTTDPQDAIADALQTQLSHITSFDRWLHQRIEANEDHNGIVSRVRQRLGRYKDWVLEVQQTSSYVASDAESWAVITRVSPGSGGGRTISVSGPGSEGSVDILAKDEEEAQYILSDKYLGCMIKICNAFAQAQSTILSLLQTTMELDREEPQLSQPPEDTVQTHIRRLKEYNDMKDIGQQLIGLIAENRGVRVGTLYESGEFGVTPDD
ncbi:hypothetical protein VTK26DRAFT_6416 [Humicola hyalothermophila]